jgi:hypothetical protein
VEVSADRLSLSGDRRSLWYPVSYAALICSMLFRNFRFLVNNEITQVAITYLFGILSYVIA